MGLIVVLAIIAVGGCRQAEDEAVVVPVVSRLEAAETLRQAGKYSEAMDLVQAQMIATPNDVYTHAMAMDLHQAMGQYDEAANTVITLVKVDDRKAGVLLVRAFNWHLRAKNFTAAERDLLTLLELQPDNVEAHRLLATLYCAQGRRFEADEHLKMVVRAGQATTIEILATVDLPGPFSLATFDNFIDPETTTLFDLGRARFMHTASRLPAGEVLPVILAVRKTFPESNAAAALQGRVLVESAMLTEFAVWTRSLPQDIETQPEYWYAVGTWLMLDEQFEQAIRSFAEALLRDHGDRGSVRGMIDCLEKIGRAEIAGQLREHLATLDQIYRGAKDADPTKAAWISDQYQKLGRPLESTAWLQVAAERATPPQKNGDGIAARLIAVRRWEDSATPTKIRDAGLERLIGFRRNQFPLPTIDGLSEPAGDLATKATSSLEPSPTSIVMEDVAPAHGLVTSYHSGFSLDGGELAMTQVNGGGLAAVDFDLDGRVDIYVVQSDGPPHDRNGSFPNEYFRQLPGGSFAQHAGDAGCDDRGLGQGVCAGDLNQDGFIDLAIANVGLNSFYMNQGDGTFRRDDSIIVGQAPMWTSVLAIADLTGDGLPDIYEANYIDDERAYDVRCKENDTPCQPQFFNAAADVIYRGNADGTFTRWEGAPEIDNLRRLGFGTIIANFDRRDGNDVFVSNDVGVNFFWASVASGDSKDDRFSLVESALVRGCGVGRGGDSQGCMGIASGDFDRNGTLDLHVTNFYREEANLFMQNDSGSFSDEVIRYRLAGPSLNVLGFGTQAADLDNDGWLDLVVLNGHVYDARDEGVPLMMRPQCFRGSRGRFDILESDRWGEYGNTPQVGRALATLDYDGDGRMDMVANHLDQPISLLENRSEAGNWVAFELIGTAGERDAIGAEVRVVAGDQTWTAWQIGGDGYMVTNEPVVHVGIGAVETIDRIEVRWPGGETQTFADVDTNHRHVIVEGDADLFTR